MTLNDGKLDVVISITAGSTVTKTFKLKVEDGHAHSYSDWEKYNETHHRKTCTSDAGECLAPVLTAAHSWGTGAEEAVTENGVVIATKTTYTCVDCSETKVTQNSEASILALTVPTGAKAQLYTKNNYYNYTEHEALASSENENNTVTYYFNADTKKGTWIYRVSKPGELTRAGYLAWGTKNLTVTHSEDDPAPSGRIDYAAAGGENSSVAEDGVLLNINRQNFLAMSVGGTKTLKAYRVWELVESYMNTIVTPDFHYTVISGDDVVTLTDKASPSAGDGDWKTLTAVKEGTAVIEVTYDALQLDGGSYDGVYGASDSARTGLMIVQAGGETADVDFGIQSKASQGTKTSALTYSASNAKPWDAEFDTLYFTGESGELKLSPTVKNGTLAKVEVSGDKGESWAELTAEDGIYTAPIVSGNNIIKVTADTGVSYQVVRGDKITVKYVEKTDAAANPADGDGTIEAGETIRVILEGLHQPIPKLSGNYNPGYKDNVDGDGSVRLKYQFNGEEVSCTGSQYTFITDSNYVELVIPAEDTKAEYTLSEGYISVGVLGLPMFANEGADDHRNIPDEGCNTRGGTGISTYNTRCILPEITINVGGVAAPNTAPVVKGDAVTEASIVLGQNYAINPELLFNDAEGNPLTYTVSINNGTAEAADASFKYTPAAAGTYTIKFTANDGELTAEHIITLTVAEPQQKPETPTGPVFSVPEGQIAGYVTVSFEDFAARKAGETGLKYPKALGTIVPATRVPYMAGESIADVTLRLLDAYGIGYRTSYGQYGFYLASIRNFEVNNTPYDEMGEFDAGAGSGWMITHNNVFIGQSAGNVDVKNGDRIEWKYTCQLGSDIGDPFFDDKKEEVQDVTSGAAGTDGSAATTTTPTQVTVSGTTATAAIKKEHVSETLKQAIENKSEEIVVQVSGTDTKGAAAVQVQLDTQTVKDVVSKTEAALTIKTENGSVTLDRETLKTVAAEASGETVTLEVTEVVVPTAAQKEAAGEDGHVIQLTIKSGDKIISGFQGGKAAVTVEIPAKLAGKKIAAIHIGDDGKIERLKGEEIEVNGKKHYRFETPHFSTFALIDEEANKLTAEDAAKLLEGLTPEARSVKTAKKNIKVTLQLDDADQEIISKIQAAGYSVKYSFFRSNRKSAGYRGMLRTDRTVYTNTKGDSGDMYFYKARVQVYDAEGKLVAKTELKDCKYAKRVWTK